MLTQIKKPDVKGPRFRKSFRCIINDKFYKKFRTQYPQHSKVENGDIKKIASTFNSLIWKEVIENRDGVEFPEGLGFCFIGACPPPKRRESLDPAVSLKHNKRIRYRNFHSDNLLAKIFYTNYANKYNFSQREAWQFKPARPFTRAVSKAFEEKYMNYVKVDSYRHINKMFKEASRKSEFKNRTSEMPNTYNEFDLD